MVTTRASSSAAKASNIDHSTGPMTRAAQATINSAINSAITKQTTRKRVPGRAPKSSNAARNANVSMPAFTTASHTFAVVPASALTRVSNLTATAGASLDPASGTAASAPTTAATAAGQGPVILSKRTRDNQGREPNKRTKRDYSGTIAVLVGPRETLFTVHEDRICKVSPFFDAACKDNWTEGQSRTVRLPEQHTRHFRFYFDWVYSSRLDLSELKQELLTANGGTEHTWFDMEYAHTHCRTWVLADYLGDEGCKRACMEALVAQQLPYRLLRRTIDFITENTAVESGLFRWMLDVTARKLCLNWTATTLEDFADGLPLVVQNALMKMAFVALRDGKNFKARETDVTRYLDQVEASASK